MDRRSRLPRVLFLLFCLPPAVALIGLAADTVWGGGHPPLGAALVLFEIYPTLTGYLSRAFLGSDWPSYFLIVLALMEYPLVGFGLGSIFSRSRLGLAVLLVYTSAQLAAHVLLNLHVVNVHLVSHANPAVSEAAVDRIRDSGDTASLPTLQQKALEEFARQGFAESTLLDALTQLGGAKGWQDLLESGRPGVAGRDARIWRGIIQNVREMTNPYYAESRGGVKSPYWRDQDITRLFDALALKLAEHLKGTADSEASLTLLTLMRNRPDLCAKYFEIVPNGLRDKASQATLELAGNLAAIKAGRPPDNAYNYQAFLSRDEIAQIGREQTVVADTWAAWVKSDASPCGR
jgi:hypothetical protein